MAWLGKMVGGTFGFVLGGPLGAILGAAIGHQFDRNAKEDWVFPRLEPSSQQRMQMAFFTALFSVMGHLAKADGRVTEAEIDLARQVMDKMGLSQTMRQEAIRLFREGKSASFPLDETLAQLRRETMGHSALLRTFLEVLMQTAYADGSLHPAEERLLLYICQRLGISRFELQALRTFMEAQLRFSQAYSHYRSTSGDRQPPPSRFETSLSEAYALLGVSPNASDAEVTRAYRRLISKHHPDKLVAQGLPEEMVKRATEKTQQIRKAYEIIQAHRQRRKA